MKEVVQVVRLNDFEIDTVRELAPHIRKLGKGFRWKFDVVSGRGLMYYIEDASNDKIVITGRFGDPTLRLMVKGNHVSFSTVGSISPEALFYNLIHLLIGACNCKMEMVEPPLDIYETFSTDLADYYIMNNTYTARIADYFERMMTAERDYSTLSGMFYIETACDAYGKDEAKHLVQQFAEKSLYDEVAFALVFHRGHCLPLFYGNGAIFCLITEKDYIESILEDFTRIFMKLAIPKDVPEFNMKNGLRASPEHHN